MAPSDLSVPILTGLAAGLGVLAGLLVHQVLLAAWRRRRGVTLRVKQLLHRGRAERIVDRDLPGLHPAHREHEIRKLIRRGL